MRCPPLIQYPEESLIGRFMADLFAARRKIAGTDCLDVRDVDVVVNVFAGQAARDGVDDWFDADIEQIAERLPPALRDRIEFWFEAVGIMTCDALHGDSDAARVLEQIDAFELFAPRHPALEQLYAVARAALQVLVVARAYAN